MTMREVRAVLFRGGKIGFSGADGTCEVSLQEDGVHVTVIPFDGDEPHEYVGDFAGLYALMLELNAFDVDVCEIAENIH